MMKITGLSHLFKWENLHNWWLTKYFFAPLYINHQGGLSSKRLFIPEERLLRWAQLNLRSLRAMHVWGKLNLGADMLSSEQCPLR